MDSRLFDRDPLTGITRIFHYDDATEDSTIETISDVTDIIEDNKAYYNDVDERAGWKNEFMRVASIPMPLYFKMKEEGIVGDQKAMKKWLNDPDNKYFRTRPGRI